MHDPEVIRDCAAKIEALDEQIAKLNAEKAKVYQFARDVELDLPALRKAISLNRADDNARKAFADRSKLVADYLKAIRANGSSRARAPAREGGAKLASAPADEMRA
jgi:uncharacterized protein (UPF0335 family)